MDGGDRIAQRGAYIRQGVGVSAFAHGIQCISRTIASVSRDNCPSASQAAISSNCLKDHAARDR
jgi:hypothetical protein